MTTGTLPTVLAVACGGAVGAVLRWAAGLAGGASDAPAYVATLTVNTIGCFGIGLAVALLPDGGRAALLRPLIITGLLGGLTTFSSFGLEVVELLGDRRWGTALLYAGGSLVLGLGAVAMGLALGPSPD